MQETQVQSLGWEDLLEKRMAPRSSTLASRIPWTEEPGGLQSMGLQNVSHDWATTNFTFILRPECHVYSTSFEGWDGRIVHFLIILLAFTWLPGGLPVTEEILGGLVPTTTELWEQGGVPALSSPHIPLPRFSPNAFSKTDCQMFCKRSLLWTHFTGQRLNSKRYSKNHCGINESSRRHCVLSVVLFTGPGFRGTGMGKCTS